MQTSSSSWHELLWGRNGLRSFALAGGVALPAINIFIATTILPSVVQDIGGLEYYAWNTTPFVAASVLGSSCAPIDRKSAVRGKGGSVRVGLGGGRTLKKK